MKILNLYAGIGGNRKLWEGHQVTAVELDPAIAEIYQGLYPEDTVLVQDAHAFLIENHQAFDFIWSSPPCPTHSRVNRTLVGNSQILPRYADMTLYQEVIFLKHWAKCLWVVENVIPYYEPLIPGKKSGGHIFWSNFNIGYFPFKARKIMEVGGYSRFDHLGIDYKILEGFHGRREQLLQNMIHYELGLYVLNCARDIITKSNILQGDLFFD